VTSRILMLIQRRGIGPWWEQCQLSLDPEQGKDLSRHEATLRRSGSSQVEKHE
jgi:hypothetical protein